jgi:CheY-like chemotaxis protein
VASILYIDDDSDEHEIFTMALRLNMPTVSLLTASESTEAMNVVSQNLSSIKLVFLDLNLGKGKRGFEILKELKKNPTTKSIPVIVFTSSQLVSDRDESLLLGADAFVVKPTSFVELRKLLTRIFADYQL